MSKQIFFNKYQIRGSDYHYQQINKFNVFKFNAFVLARYQNLINIVIKFVKANFSANKTYQVLDLGCGDGVLLYLLKQQLPDYHFSFTGVDNASQALQIAQCKLPTAKFINHSILNVKLPHNYYDIVLCSDVIEHLPSPEKLIGWTSKLVKKMGLLVVGTPIRFTEKPIDKLHSQELFPNELINMAKKYFSNIQLIESHNLLFYLLYQNNLFRYLINIFVVCFNINPFLKIKTSHQSPLFYSYMYLVCYKILS